MKIQLIMLAVLVTSLLRSSFRKNGVKLYPISNRSPLILTGSDTQSGTRYDLNLIDGQKNITTGMSGDNGHRIYYPLVED